MAKISIFGALSNVQILFKTMISGGYVGTDGLGNKYYRARARKGTRRERRWVIYKGAPEASMVPPEWHGWLHHQTNAVPGSANPLRQPWQKPHLPNMTGTANPYLPQGHTLKGGHRAAATGDYESWQPPQ